MAVNDIGFDVTKVESLLEGLESRPEAVTRQIEALGGKPDLEKLIGMVCEHAPRLKEPSLKMAYSLWDRYQAAKAAGNSAGMYKVVQEGIELTKIVVTAAMGIALKEHESRKVQGDRITAVRKRMDAEEKSKELEILNQKLQELNQKLYISSTHDKLTGIYNRTYFGDHDGGFQIAYKTAQKHTRPLSLIVFDINNFKGINDKYGHDAADEVLKELSKYIGSQIRPEDLFARIGGDEFALLLQETAEKGGEALAEKLRKGIKEHQFPKGIKVSLSMGVKQAEPGESWEDFYRGADSCFYASQALGKDCTVTYSFLKSYLEKEATSAEFEILSSKGVSIAEKFMGGM